MAGRCENERVCRYSVGLGAEGERNALPVSYLHHAPVNAVGLSDTAEV